VPPVDPAAPRFAQGRAEIRTEQLLLALIAHEEGVATHALSQLGVDLERAAVATTAIRFPRPAAALWSFGEWPPAAPKTG